MIDYEIINVNGQVVIEKTTIKTMLVNKITKLLHK